MAKMEQSFMEPVRKTNLGKVKWKIESPFIYLQTKIETLLLKKGYLLFIIGFLLGRALILATLTPFSLPFFATVYLIRRDKAPLTLIGIIAGAATLSIMDAHINICNHGIFYRDLSYYEKVAAK